MRRELADVATATAFAMHKPEDLQRVLAPPAVKTAVEDKWWQPAAQEKDD